MCLGNTFIVPNVYCLVQDSITMAIHEMQDEYPVVKETPFVLGLEIISKVVDRVKKRDKDLDLAWDGVRHYWLVRGYIDDEDLFLYINKLRANQDPFQDEALLRRFARRVLIKHDVLYDGTDRNAYISGFTINSERFDQIYAEEFQRLNEMVGQYALFMCDNCGETLWRVVNPRESFDTEGEQIYSSVQKGRLYFMHECKKLGVDVYDRFKLDANHDLYRGKWDTSFLQRETCACGGRFVWPKWVDERHVTVECWECDEHVTFDVYTGRMVEN